MRERLQRFLDVGYNYVMVQPSLPGLPHHIRQDWLTRFAPRRHAPFRGAAAAVPQAAAAPCRDALTPHAGASMSDIILETHGLTREFSGFVAVNNVDLRVREGSICALIGPNGAGKTTCFNLLTKFLQPTRGQIRFKRQRHHRARAGGGRAAGARPQLPDLRGVSRA